VQPVWVKPPQILNISQRTLHLWRVNLAIAPDDLAHLSTLLSDEEAQRAQRFRFDRDRHRFIAARGTLRQLLSHYLQSSATQIQFAYGAHGKPEVAYPKTDLTFNLAHSQNTMVCAVTQQHRVGVDLEFLRETSDILDLARRFFQPAEFAAISQLDETEQQQTFFRLWTAKEAVLKALGSGLAGLAGVEFRWVGDQLELTRLEQETVAPSKWLIQGFTLPEGMGAIACEQNDLDVDCFEWGQ